MCHLGTTFKSKMSEADFCLTHFVYVADVAFAQIASDQPELYSDHSVILLLIGAIIFLHILI